MENLGPYESLSSGFKKFATEEVQGVSPLYERLSCSIAKDPEILALARHARKGQRVPNLFFAAVHFLLLRGTKHPVARFYRSISGTGGANEDPYPEFRSFCMENAEGIRDLISVRSVQTNEVSRCSFLLPAFTFASRQARERPLYLIELN